MHEYDIAVIGGDGIGPEVTAEALKVVEAAAEIYGFGLRLEHCPYGSEHYFKTGEILPDAAFEEIKDQDAIFLGAIGDPRAPVGLIEYGIIARLRFDLDLYINLRPVKVYDERLCPLKGKSASDIDMLWVRENTEGAYVGAHGFAHKGQASEVATQTLVYTRGGVERTIRYAFDLARKRARGKRVTLVDKANAVRAHDLWTRVFAEVSAEYPDITTDHAYVDAACMWMVKNPEWFDVGVTTNMFGDIITDLGAVLQGGLGIAASANIHPGERGLFEPIHGSAPKYAGKNSASPVAAIMAGGMMLEYLGQKEAADTIERVVVDLLKSGRIKGVSNGLHPTSELGDLVASELRTAVAGTKG
jgi:3-isopropylmalate dehydrogenase